MSFYVNLSILGVIDEYEKCVSQDLRKSIFLILLVTDI